MIKSLMLVAVTVFAACGIAAAQSSSDALKAHLSQPVTVGSIQIPAGDCSITVLNNGNNILLIRSESGPKALILVNPISYVLENSRVPGLVLALRDGAYRLDQVRLSNGVVYQVIGSFD